MNDHALFQGEIPVLMILSNFFFISIALLNLFIDRKEMFLG